MSLDFLRPHAKNILKPLAAALFRAGATPDLMSVISLIFAAGAGLLYAISDGSRSFVLAA